MRKANPQTGSFSVCGTAPYEPSRLEFSAALPAYKKYRHLETARRSTKLLHQRSALHPDCVYLDFHI